MAVVLHIGMNEEKGTRSKSEWRSALRFDFRDKQTLRLMDSFGARSNFFTRLLRIVGGNFEGRKKCAGERGRRLVINEVDGRTDVWSGICITQRLRDSLSETPTISTKTNDNAANSAGMYGELGKCRQKERLHLHRRRREFVLRS